MGGGRIRGTAPPPVNRKKIRGFDFIFLSILNYGFSGGVAGGPINRSPANPSRDSVNFGIGFWFSIGSKLFVSGVGVGETLDQFDSYRINLAMDFMVQGGDNRSKI